MFCKQCGKKVASGIPRCPHCGRAADVLSGGTGFWDLADPPQMTAPVPAPAPAPVQIPEPQPIPQPVPVIETPPPVVEKEIETPRKNSAAPLLLVAGLVVLILVIALAVTAVRAGRLSDRLEEANAALAMQEAEEAQEETPEAPQPSPEPSPVITPVVSEAPTPEASPSEKPEPSEEPKPSETPKPSPEPKPSETPKPSEEPEEAVPAANDNVAENPAAPITAAFSKDMNRVTLTVAPGQLKVAEYQWIIVYDTGIKTAEDCLKVLAETQVQEDPTLKTAMREQVDPYDSSSGKASQELDLSVFYPDHTAFGKRVFCKMTLEDGSVQCSRLISPGPAAAKEYVVTRQRKDTLTVEVTLPEDVEGEKLSVSYMEILPMEEVATGDMTDYAPDLRLEIPLREGGTYYVILGTGDAVYPIAEAITPES